MVPATATVAKGVGRARKMPDASALPPPMPTRNPIRMIENEYTDEPITMSSARVRITS